MLRRSLLIAFLIGTILVAINQADLLLHDGWRPSLIWKVPLTYLVPFVVATWSALINSRIRPEQWAFLDDTMAPGPRTSPDNVGREPD